MGNPDTSLETLANELRRTIDQGLVRTLFQPIIGLDRAEVRAYEALTRPLPDSAFSDPGHLFDTAEQTGLLWELETLTRRTALEAASDWPAGVLLFLNCTPQVFADERFAETLLAEVDAIEGLTPRRIVLEVTERSEHQHVAGLHVQALALQKHGFQLAIDDVGAGASGLNRIMLLRPDWLKLDRELVDQIDRDPVRNNLVRFLTHFAKLSGVTIIAEGIERVAELDQLIELGVHCAQGFLIGKPGELAQRVPDDIADRIRASSRGLHGNGIAGERGNRLARIIHPAHAADADQTIAEVADELPDPSGPRGVIVLDDGAFVGWISRTDLRRNLTVRPGSIPIGSVAVPCHRTLSADATIDQAFEFAAALASRGLDHPIFVTEQGRVVGLIESSDLFRAAAEACRSTEHRIAPLTGLHGRVRCEQRLEQALAAAQDLDAAFIDLRGLGDYNAVFGFELGDEIIRQLVDVVGETIAEHHPETPEAFLGHLGDDRLLAVIPSGNTADIAHEIISRFEARVTSRGISPPAALSGLGAPSAISTIAVRFLAVCGIATHHDDARDLLRVEPTLRALADEQAAMKPASAGYVVVVDAEPPAMPLRLAA